MRNTGAGVTIGLLVAAMSLSAPGAAFALRLGPVSVGLPLLGHSLAHRHRPGPHRDGRTGVAVYDSTETPGAAGQESSRPATGSASALLYPSLALPAIYDDVFLPASSSPGPFDYDAIFQVAFGKAAGGRDRNVCQPDRGSVVIERIAREVRPSTAQRRLVQRLGGALAMASGFVAKFCPNDVPSQPVARLRLVETQLQALTVALDIVRPPLQELEQSLNRNQQAHLAAALSTPSAGSRNAAASFAPACGATLTAVDRAMDELNQSVQPNDAQRPAMAAAKHAFSAAASSLDAQCAKSLPTTLLERLHATQARLDAQWRAVLTVRVALENLESGLSDEQRVRLNALDFAAGSSNHP